ncbi:Os06g0164600, partial [Oryza sativa Japonica Group]
LLLPELASRTARFELSCCFTKCPLIHVYTLYQFSYFCKITPTSSIGPAILQSSPPLFRLVPVKPLPAAAAGRRGGWRRRSPARGPRPPPLHRL